MHACINACMYCYKYALPLPPHLYECMHVCMHACMHACMYVLLCKHAASQNDNLLWAKGATDSLSVSSTPCLTLHGQLAQEQKWATDSLSVSSYYTQIIHRFKCKSHVLLTLKRQLAQSRRLPGVSHRQSVCLIILHKAHSPFQM
jgi:hypothetical protein